MTIRKYLSLFFVMLLSVGAHGQSDFNPSNPPEPSAYWLLTVKASPAEAGTVTGGGKYVEGRQVTVTATAASVAWRFTNWTNSLGEEVSTSSNYKYTMTGANETLTANFVPVETSTITLSYTPPSGGTNFSLSGAGSYAVGTSVTISATSYSNWTFQNWTRKSDSEVMSTSRSFTYVTTSENVEFVANYKFTPGSNPSEPSETKPSHKVYFSSEPTGASFDKSNGFSVREEESFSVYAYTRSNYNFAGWYIGDQLQTTSQTYTGVMGTENVTLLAKYTFNPSGPSDPSSDTQTRYTLYGQTVSLYQGEIMMFPVYLENTSAVKELTFSLVLPEGLTSNAANIQTTGRTSAYTVNGTLEEQVLTVSLTGGSQFSDVNGAIVQIPITTTAAAVDGLYDVDFGTVTLTLLDDSTPTVSTRRGQVEISTLDEGDLQAQFSVDRHMNRAQFTNLSTESCRSFVWDFGDGETSTEVSPMHVYAAAGTYTVRLTAKGLVKTSEAEQNIIINAPSTWTAEGDYTINRNGVGVRNFVSLYEAVDLLSRCTPSGTITVTVRNDDVYNMDATSDDALTLINTLTSKLNNTNNLLNFIGADETESSTISFAAAAESNSLKSVVELTKLIYAEKVNIVLNGADIDPQALRNIVDQTVCAESDTQVLPLTSFSSSANLSVSWEATSVGDHLSGHTANGTGDLTAMQIANNSGSAGTAVTEAVIYTISYQLSGVEMYATTHAINVRPLLQRQLFYYVDPSNNVTINHGSTTVRWKNMGSIATSYTLTLQWVEADGETAGNKVVNLSSNYYSFNAIPGATYTWQVTAHGECDDNVGPEQTFQVQNLSDLQVVLNAPETAKIQNTITLQAVITNVGEGQTKCSSWTDALYVGSDDSGINNATRMASFSRSRSLAAGQSYTVSYDVTIPDNVSEIYYYFKTDTDNLETEVSKDNNVSMAHIQITANYVDADDYAILRAVYEANGGTGWTNQWAIGSNEINSSAWPGVTFDNNGKVTAIDLSNNNLTGNLPVQLLGLTALRTLNLSGNGLGGNLQTLFENVDASNSLTSFYVAGNQLTGNLYDAVVKLPNVASLNASNNKIRDFSPLTANASSNWSVGGQDLTTEHYTYSQLYNMQGVSHELLPSILFFNGNSYRSYVSLYVCDAEVSVNYTWGMAFDWYGQGSNSVPSYFSYNNPYGWYRGTSGQLMHVYTNNSRTGHHFLMDLDFEQGDANFDTVIDISDMQLTLNYALNPDYRSRYYPLNFTAADVIVDNNLNVQDVVATINLLLDQDITPTLAARREAMRTPSATDTGVSAPDAYLYVSDGKLILNISKPVTAFDFIFTEGNIQWLPIMDFFTKKERSANGSRRVIFYSLFGDEIPAGEHVLAQISADLVDAMLAEISSEKLKVSLSAGDLTAIDGVILSDEAGDENQTVYDLQGRRMKKASLSKGVYIMNGKKCIVK